MAERRMFAKTIIDSDLFLDMPQSAQLLYFHLSMRADDDGFINNPRSIMRNVRCNDDDLKLLIAKQFIIPFDTDTALATYQYLVDRWDTTFYHSGLIQLLLLAHTKHGADKQYKCLVCCDTGWILMRQNVADYGDGILFARACILSAHQR